MPGILYYVGLYNIHGKPEISNIDKLDENQLKSLLTYHKEENIPEIRRVNPWEYTFTLLTNESSSIPSGTNIVWSIVRSYNSNNIKNKRMIYWHLSGAALTIWLSNNWTQNQIMAKAYEISEQEKHLTSKST